MTTPPTLKEFDNLDLSLHADTGRAEEYPLGACGFCKSAPARTIFGETPACQDCASQQFWDLFEALRVDSNIARRQAFGVDDQEAVGGLKDDGTERWCDPAK